jgi:hypothetical protein
MTRWEDTSAQWKPRERLVNKLERDERIRSRDGLVDEK